MSAKRSYCLDDKPFPVGKKAMRTLEAVQRAAFMRTCFLASDATRQVERLRRSGYVTVSPGGFVYITEAGTALLKKS